MELRAGVWVLLAILALESMAPAIPGAGMGPLARVGLTSMTVGGTAPPPTDRYGWINETSKTDDPSPALLSSSPSVFDPRGGTAVAFGGIDAAGNVSSTTWLWDDGAWENHGPLIGTPPPPRLYGANLAYDASDGYLLLFGGRAWNGVLANETWSYQGNNWTNRSPPGSPPAECGGAMAYDPASGVVVLEEPVSNLTWTYHAGVWTSRSLSPDPGRRSGAVLVTDTSAGNVFLFGGEELDRQIQANDTWTYSNGVWTRLAVSGAPPVFHNASGTDDPFLRSVFVVGSLAGGPTETWNYSSRGWTEYASSAQNPPPRRDATLAYDTTGVVVLCGGTDPSGARWLDDCWAWGVPIPPRSPLSNAPPVDTVLVAGLVAIVAVPVAISVYLSRRPRRPDPTRTPSPARSGESVG